MDAAPLKSCFARPSARADNVAGALGASSARDVSPDAAAALAPVASDATTSSPKKRKRCTFGDVELLDFAPRLVGGAVPTDTVPVFKQQPAPPGLAAAAL